MKENLLQINTRHKGKFVRLGDIHPGLFMYPVKLRSGITKYYLGVKTEYKHECGKDWVCDAFLVDSGEYFCGEQDDHLVIPVNYNISKNKDK